MAVEKIYQPYDEATQTSIPQRQPQSSPEKQTVKRKVVVQLTRFEKILYIALITVIA
ncbi:cell division protein FtsL, partial [Staphylococcus caprae]